MKRPKYKWKVIGRKIEKCDNGILNTFTLYKNEDKTSPDKYRLVCKQETPFWWGHTDNGGYDLYHTDVPSYINLGEYKSGLTNAET